MVHKCTGTKRSDSDASLRLERVKTDAALSAERDMDREDARASLLSRARQETDSRLLLERVHVDESLLSCDGFVALMRHELRSLLGIIAVSTAAIEKQTQAGPARVMRYSAPIKRSMSQMAHLVSELLDVASSTGIKSPSSEAAMAPSRSITEMPRLRRRQRRRNALFRLAPRSGR